MSLDLVDIGANLTHESFAHDLADVLARAAVAGVRQMVVTGASRAHSPQAQAMAAAHPGQLWATAGVHPHHALEYSAECHSEMQALLRHPQVVAAGECGLDYYRNYSPRPQQLHAFERQLELAVESGKPVFLHQRDAHADFMAVLKPYRDRLCRAVVHCFTGTREELFDYLDWDLHVGITGWICDERRGQHLREFVREIPAGRLMIETDSPYLLPRNLEPKPKDRRNEPKNLPHICRELARDRGETAEAAAAHTSATARAFFGLPALSPSG